VEKTGGDYLSFLELRSVADVAVADAAYQSNLTMGELVEEYGIQLSQEANMTYDSDKFVDVSDICKGNEDPRDPAVAARLREQGYLILHEGKTFHQYDDRWGERPRYLVKLADLSDKPGWVRAAQYYRLAFRSIARSTDERTAIFTILPPGVVSGNSAPIERAPEARPNSAALAVMALANSFPFDWLTRIRASANINLFILEGVAVPMLENDTSRFLAKQSLAVCARHAGYGDLVKEIDCDKCSLSPEAELQVLASIDATVAHLYGLSEEQYTFLLSSFNHARRPTLPTLCLKLYRELKQSKPDAFQRKYDALPKVNLPETNQTPTLNLARTIELEARQGSFFLESPAPRPRTRRNRGTTQQL